MNTPEGVPAAAPIDPRPKGGDELSRGQLLSLASLVETDSPISPQGAHQLLSAPSTPHKGRIGRFFSSIAAIPSFLAASVVTETALAHNPDLQTGVEVPIFLHDLMVKMWGWLPHPFEFRSPDLLQHLPPTLGAIAVGGVIGLVAQAADTFALRPKLEKAQQLLRERAQQGQVRWDLSAPDREAYVAYVGGGSKIATNMAREYPEIDMVRVSYEALPASAGPYTVLPENADLADALRQFDRAGARDATMVVFMGKAGLELFQAPDGNDPSQNDIGVARAEAAIKRYDTVCKNAGINPRTVFVIGSEQQAVDYVRYSQENTDGSKTIKISTEHDTLVSHMTSFTEQRKKLYGEGAEVVVIDPTKLVVDAIFRRIVDPTTGNIPPVQFTGKKESVDLFASSFFAALPQGNGIDTTLAPVIAEYNLSDRATEDHATSEPLGAYERRIVIVHDAKRGEAILNDSGMDPEDLIVPSRLVLAKIREHLANSTTPIRAAS